MITKYDTTTLYRIGWFEITGTDPWHCSCGVVVVNVEQHIFFHKLLGHACDDKRADAHAG